MCVVWAAVDKSTAQSPDCHIYSTHNCMHLIDSQTLYSPILIIIVITCFVVIKSIEWRGDVIRTVTKWPGSQCNNTDDVLVLGWFNQLIWIKIKLCADWVIVIIVVLALPLLHCTRRLISVTTDCIAFRYRTMICIDMSQTECLRAPTHEQISGPVHRHDPLDPWNILEFSFGHKKPERRLMAQTLRRRSSKARKSHSPEKWSLRFDAKCVAGVSERECLYKMLMNANCALKWSARTSINPL